MYRFGDIIQGEEASGTVYYVVTEINGRRPILERLEDFIIRNYVVKAGDVYLTLKEIIEDEKQRAIKEGVIDVSYD